MDAILFLLMHTMRGLKLSPQEVLTLLKAGPEIQADPSLALNTSVSREYLRSCPDWLAQSQKIFDEGQAQQVRWSRIGADDYPLEWLMLSNAPPVFCYRGSPSWRTTPYLAVVGSRTPTTDSRQWLRRELGLFLRDHDVGVVSGGARGIDQCAHRTAMDYERPTVCLLPSGLLTPYPHDHQKFWDEILDTGGALISTFGLSAPMRKNFFQTRNRWITGLSPIVFVVEANRRSGSSMTGNLAKDEGRTVCTLPVFPHSSQGLGNLDLLFNGAHLLRDHRDLSSLWDLSSRPTLFERADRERKEQNVHQPQA